MSIEVEQKYRIDNPAAVLSGIAELGATSRQVVRQVDSYYSHPIRDFAASDEALRVRHVGQSNFITYKGPKLDAKTKTRREIELPLATGDDAAAGYDELLDALGFHRVAEVSKVRQIFQLQREGQTIELVVDEVHDVGNFVELEIVVDDESEIPIAQQQIATLASELQLADAERRSYLELLLATQSD